MKTISLILVTLFAIGAKDLDTTTIEMLVIEKTYEFGWPIKDTVHSIIHLPSRNGYHIHCADQDYFSNTKPVLLRRYKRLKIKD